MSLDLRELAQRARGHPGLLAKRAIGAVAEMIGGDGGDAAVIAAGRGSLIVAGAEAIWPPFIQRAPRAAGIAGVVAALNDVAATGGRPLAVLDTVAAAERETVEAILAGLREASELYRTPIVGGHLTLAAGLAPSLSTMALGSAREPLVAANARAGDDVTLVTCVEGEALAGAEGELFFSHLRGPRRERAADDLALLADVAEAGDAWAARDVSMPGMTGSLLQLLESAGGLGCAVDLGAVEPPDGMTLGDWLGAFPSFGFLVVGDAPALTERFRSVGLTAARIATLDTSGRLRLARGADEAEVWDLGAEPLTGLGTQLP